MTSKLARPSAAEFFAGRLTAPPRMASFAQMPFCRNSGKRPTGEGQVETGVITGEAGIDGADVTLEEQRLRVEVELAG